MYRARPGRNKVNSLAANDKVVCRRLCARSTTTVGYKSFRRCSG